MLQKLLRAVVYCHAVRWILRIVEWCSEVFDHSVRMLSIMAGLGCHEFGLRIWLGAQGGSQISAGREDFAGGSAVLSTLSEGLEIELSDLDAENATLKGDYLRQVLWDCDWRRSNRPWDLFHVRIHVSRQNTVARHHIDESVPHIETSSGSSESSSRHLTPWKHLSLGWYDPARPSFRTASWTVSIFQHLFPHVPFASHELRSQGVGFGHCLFAGSTE